MTNAVEWTSRAVLAVIWLQVMAHLLAGDLKIAGF
jgi:hypothetical protein